VIRPRRIILLATLAANLFFANGLSFGIAPAQNQAAAPATPAVRYTVSLAHAPQHLVEVEMSLSPGSAQRDLQLPVWNALYQVRDFAQYVNWVRAKDPQGRSLTITESDKTTWHIEGAERGATVDYEIFADQPGPFGAQLTSAHAFFNLAEILMYPRNQLRVAVDVAFSGLAANWRIATSLTPVSPAEFRAATYDDLVDAPVEIGAFQDATFELAGTHYQVVVDADPADYNLPNIVSTLKSMVMAATAWMNDRPMDHYVFLYHFPRGPAGGGMEHAFSTAIDIGARSLAENPQSLADVTAHEFFHLWNVKRIRPQSLEPIDYTRENYTRALWFSEGVTTTAANCIRLRAGLLDERRFLDALGDEITSLERRPAHLTQSVEESSLDAWLEKYEYYRQPQRSVSYYNKGNLLGVMLDLEIREASHGSASLRDMFQWMNQHYAKAGRFFPDTEGVREAADAVSHSHLAWFFGKYVAGTDPIPYDDFLTTVGLHTVRGTAITADLGFAMLQNGRGRNSVAAVDPRSAAQQAGLRAGDEILELNHQPVAPGFEDELAQLRPGDTIHLRIRGSQGERDLAWTLGSREEVVFEVKDVDNVSPQQRARRVAWLAGESQK
jgi:predicted metalloprotease with PDZ domain